MAGTDGSAPHPLTAFNKPVLDEVWLSETESFWFKSFDGMPVQAFFLKPFGFDPVRKYPMVLIPRGGPHGLNGHNFRFTFQMYPANGYVALMVNYRGSTSYGQRFADADFRDLLGGDFKDLMAGLDYALDNYPYIDGDRLGVTGGSYGGYLTNWIITQTNRFKAAIPMASISNMVSYYGTASNQLWTEHELGAKFWEDWAIYRRTSPLTHVANVQTPTYFIQGQEDHTCPVEQAEEMFMGLRKRGIPTILVVYPGEGHSRTGMRPDSIRDYYRRTFLWMDYYVKGEGASPLPRETQ
jgi:dipeptidyl aminopeptidase/acylaminoacyl peptidase